MEKRSGEPTLKRSLSFPILVLYGLGTTIGAGVYALLGQVAASITRVYSAARTASALLTSNAIGSSTFRVVTTPSSTIIA